ncbi:regulatory protein, LysR:LysR, substrate-binding [Plesiocystis pacifica SIR-1]|uniref:Regulatory protein, LysR:LysR, substrate-binding n=1 Tax=Plesiocystis pacifica SIR-1 TaxID=391625 RepID=A6GA49_9BACT|nr:LysR family transcriptional regulator [Plesiocystis pacifica]EDM77262.1 regulatory protein, LysR:LysR, substrate-binding [Plesiocystis pacifica SIR-1]
MDQLHTMRVFVAVAECRGFAKAARQLGISRAAVTRAVSTLERSLGVELLSRTSRAVSPTEVGASYLVDCRRILADVDESHAAAAGAHARPTGTLRITSSVLFGQLYVLPILTDYLDAYPEVRAQALFVDRVTNMVAEGIDVAVRLGQLPDSSLMATRVGRVRRLICASPAYLERHGTPRRPEDLAEHRVVVGGGEGERVEWHLGTEEGAGEERIVRVRPRLACSTNHAAIAAATSGWGLTRVLSYQVGEALEQGRLVAVLEDCEPAPIPVHIVYPGGRHAPAKVRAFVELAAPRLREDPRLRG